MRTISWMAAIAIAICAGLGSTGSAQAASSTSYCKYRQTIRGAGTVTFVGTAPSSYVCRAFGTGANLPLYYGPVRGTMYCRLQSRRYSMSVTVFATQAFAGRYMCGQLQKIPGWIRTA